MAKRSAAMPKENMPALGYTELGHATQPPGLVALSHYSPASTDKLPDSLSDVRYAFGIGVGWMGEYPGLPGNPDCTLCSPFFCFSIKNPLQWGNSVHSLYRVVEEVAIHLAANRD
jgi:hypothetical protein